MINSGCFGGVMAKPQGVEEITQQLVDKGIGERKVTYSKPLSG